MKILLLTGSTEGDTHPLAAPGHALAIIAARLGEALAFADHDGARRQSAPLGGRMRREDGCVAAVALVGRCAAR